MGLSDVITRLPELIGQAVEANRWLGYTAIFAAMFLENLFPPIPSELIMPLGGFYVQQGQLQLIPVVIAGLLGTVLGALPWYGIGRLINEERIEQWLARHGRWIGISPEELARSRRWFTRYGTALVFWGRLVPGIRTLISVPAGIEMMPMAPFLIWTTAGSLIWTMLLTVAGMVLGWNFGDGHLHDERLLAAIARTCPFERGELRCLFVESQPALRGTLHARVYDAVDGQLYDGQLEVDALLQRQGALQVRVEWRRGLHHRAMQLLLHALEGRIQLLLHQFLVVDLADEALLLALLHCKALGARLHRRDATRDRGAAAGAEREDRAQGDEQAARARTERGMGAR